MAIRRRALTAAWSPRTGPRRPAAARGGAEHLDEFPVQHPDAQSGSTTAGAGTDPGPKKALGRTVATAGSTQSVYPGLVIAFKIPVTDHRRLPT